MEKTASLLLALAAAAAPASGALFAPKLTGLTSATSPPAGYNTISFAPISVNPTANVSHNFLSGRSVTINGVNVPIAGFKPYARSGFVDTNGAVLGQIIVRARFT